MTVVLTERFTNPALPGWYGSRRNGFVANGKWKSVIPEGQHFGTDMRFDIPGRPRVADLNVHQKYSSRFLTGATWGGKSIGFADLSHGDWGYGNKIIPIDGDGMSCRGMWRIIDGKLNWGVYTYGPHSDYTGGKSYGDSWFFGALPAGTMEFDGNIHLDLEQGYVTGSINGVKGPDFPFPVSAATTIRTVWLDDYHGGSQVPTEDLWIETDDIVVTVPTGSSGIVMPLLEYGDGMTRNFHLKYDVERLQSWLATPGFIAANTFDSKHRPDGKFGNGTRTATINFQNDQGIPATGKADAATWDRLSKWGR